MKSKQNGKDRHKRGILYLLILVFPVFILHTGTGFSQRKNSLAISVDPMISWFANENPVIDNKGSHLGLKYGLVFDHFFDENYAITTGLSFTRLGGYMAYKDSVSILSDFDTILIPPGNSIHYAIHYLNIPFGLKLKTVQIGYKTFFIDLGMNALFRLNAKASASNTMIKQPVNNEINLFNLAYYLGGGMEYSLGGSTSLMGGLYFTNTLLDLSTDALNKPPGRTYARGLSVRLGVIF